MARKSNYSSRATTRGGRSTRTCGRGGGGGTYGGGDDDDDDEDADETGSDELEESCEAEEEDSMADFAMLDDDG